MTEYRPATLSERREFYKKEFSIQKVKGWFRGRELPQLCAVDAGSETAIITNKRYTGFMFYFPFSELKEKIKKYVPEDIYYDRNEYANPKSILKTFKFDNHISQELVFDVDVDNIECSCRKSGEVCDKCIAETYRWALKMRRELKKEFRNVKIVYSGRGFHVHVLDERASRLTIKEREAYNKRFSKYPIDPWVSRGYIRLIRMPYTLNGLVSRIVKPVNVKKAFNTKSSIPRFLKTYSELPK